MCELEGAVLFIRRLSVLRRPIPNGWNPFITTARGATNVRQSRPRKVVAHHQRAIRSDLIEKFGSSGAGGRLVFIEQDAQFLIEAEHVMHDRIDQVNHLLTTGTDAHGDVSGRVSGCVDDFDTGNDLVSRRDEQGASVECGPERLQHNVEEGSDARGSATLPAPPANNPPM
jgi:hypothetical protein